MDQGTGPEKFVLLIEVIYSVFIALAFFSFGYFGFELLFASDSFLKLLAQVTYFNIVLLAISHTIIGKKPVLRLPLIAVALVGYASILIKMTDSVFHALWVSVPTAIIVFELSKSALGKGTKESEIKLLKSLILVVASLIGAVIWVFIEFLLVLVGVLPGFAQDNLSYPLSLLIVWYALTAYTSCRQMLNIKPFF